ncbi:MAG: hypothetical protein GX896_03200 [Clostridiales bacterium]|nr:hypothetical protein [Clostridiales bacterium]
MTLLNLADILAEILDFDDVYAGCLDGTKEKSIGIYNSKNPQPKRICIGGKACTRTLYKDITILIHWTDNPTQADVEAEFVANKLDEIREYQHEGFTIKLVQPNNKVWVGRDEKGICEYVINTTVIYERND